MMAAHAGLGHRNLVHRIMRALWAFWIFRQSLPCSSRQRSSAFQGFGQWCMAPFFLASVFSRNLNIVTAIKVLPPRPSAGDKHNGQGRNGTVVEVWGKGGVIYNSM